MRFPFSVVSVTGEARWRQGAKDGRMGAKRRKDRRGSLAGLCHRSPVMRPEESQTKSANRYDPRFRQEDKSESSHPVGAASNLYSSRRESATMGVYDEIQPVRPATICHFSTTTNSVKRDPLLAKAFSRKARNLSDAKATGSNRRQERRFHRTLRTGGTIPEDGDAVDDRSRLAGSSSEPLSQAVGRFLLARQ